MTLSINIEDDGWHATPDLERLAASAVAATLPAGERRDVALLFTDDATVRTINRQWRNFDKPTNVLSFPAAAMPVPEGEVAPLGDIVLARETITREAGEQGKAFAHHTTHLIVHGVLHLLGYDHETDAEALIMEAAERDILTQLGIADPYKT
jgi:probable rRNA maturation factor